MLKVNGKKLQRLVGLYLAGSMTLGGVAYASEAYMDGAITVIEDVTHQNDGIIGGSHNLNVDTSNLTINNNGEVDEIFGGGKADAGVNAQADVNRATIKINGGQIGDVYAGGHAMNGGTASIIEKSTIEITNGTIALVVGGGTANSGNVSVKETEITIQGGVISNVQGGGNAKGDNATASVDKTTININGGTIGDGLDQFGHGIFGGGWASTADTAGKTNQSNVGEVTININGGDFTNNVDNGLYGGGVAANEGGAGSASAQVDKVQILLKDVDAAGMSVFAGGTTFKENTNAVVKEASIHVSGETKIEDVYGGGDSTGGKASVDVSNITIADHASVSMVNGGGFSEGGTAEVGKVNIQINGGTVGGIHGGGTAEVFVASYDSAATTVANVNISMNAGQVSGDVYAGGVAINETGRGGKSISTVDNAIVNISGGEIGGNIYAGGYSEGTGISTVENSTINISGGEIGGNIQRGNATNAVLNFTAVANETDTGSKIGGIISGFDTVTVKNGAKTTLTGENVADGIPVIQANSLTVEDGAKLMIGKDMTIDLGNGVQTKFKLRSMRASNGMLSLAGEIKIPIGVTLTLNHTDLDSRPTGMVTVGVNKNLSSVGKLAMVNSTFVKDQVNLNIDLPIDQIAGLSAEQINQIIADALTEEIAKKTTVRNGSNAEYQYKLDENGKIIGTDLNNSYLGFYTGVRQANAYIAQSMMENVHDRNALLRGGAKTDDFWVNIRGGATDVDNQYGKAEIKNQYYQLGYDWDVSSGENKAMVGLYFSKIYGDITQHNIKSDIDNAYDFGIYGMKEFGNGTYAGLVGRYGQTKNAATIDKRNVDWKDKGYALSAEFGKRMEQKNGWMLEPYMQLTYNHLSDADLNTGSTDAALEGSSLLDGRIGVRFIQQEKANPQNTIYGGLSYVRGLSGDFKMKSKDGMNMIEADNDANAIELSVGVNRQLSQCSTLNLNAKKEFGDYDGWSVQGMVNVAF